MSIYGFGTLMPKIPVNATYKSAFFGYYCPLFTEYNPPLPPMEISLKHNLIENAIQLTQHNLNL